MKTLKKISIRIVSLLLVCTVSMALCVAYAAEDDGKQETVYVITDSTGKTEKIIVSEWLQNSDAAQVIKDKTELENIENVKGDEKYTIDGDKMTVWDAQGKDIHYQGTIDKLLPVDVAISYKLDDVSIAAKDLAGKSGKLTMRFDYTNRQKETVSVDGKNYEMYVPFLMVSGMLLDNDVFSNVEMTNGKVITDGTRTIAVGFALPGMKDNLKELSQDISIPDFVELTADVTDFKMDTTFTVAMNDIFAQDDVEIDGIDDIKAQINKLDDAAKQLVEGTKTLGEGTAQLAEKSAALPQGVSKLSGGAAALNEGLGTLSDNAGTLIGGVSSLKNGASDLKDGAAQLQAGVAPLQGGIANLAAGSKNLKGGLEGVDTGLDNLSAGLAQSVSVLEQTITKNNAVIDALTKAASATTDTATAQVLAAQIQTLTIQTRTQQAALAALKPNGAVNDGIQALKTGVGDLDDGVDQLIDGVNQLATKSTALIDGVNGLADGSATLYSGINRLYKKLPALNSGINKLTDGSAQLNSGLQTLSKSSETLVDGIQAVNDGAQTLAQGMQQFYDEGIALIMDMVNNTLPGYVNRLQATMQAAKNYNSFAGLPEDMNGSTKFIFKSAEIDKD